MKKQKTFFLTLLLLLLVMAGYYFFSMSSSKQNYSFNEGTILRKSEKLYKTSNTHSFVSPKKTALNVKNQIQSGITSRKEFYSNHFSGSRRSKTHSDDQTQDHLSSTTLKQAYTENNYGYGISKEKPYSNCQRKSTDNIQANSIDNNLGSAFERGNNHLQSTTSLNENLLASNDNSSSNIDVLMRAANEDDPPFPGDPGTLPITDGLYLLIALIGIYFLYVRKKTIFQSKTNSK